MPFRITEHWLRPIRMETGTDPYLDDKTLIDCINI